MASLLTTLLCLSCFLVFAGAVDSIECIPAPGSSSPSSSFYDFTQTDLHGKTHKFAEYEGKVILMSNVASFCGLTPSQYSAFNSLTQKYESSKFEVLGFPCGQFENQEPEFSDAEILNTLYYVRPGNGFVANFTLFEKSHVNGDDANPVWSWVKGYCSYIPEDYIMSDVSLISWSPVMSYDVAWNFEKILISKTGVPYKRYKYTLDPSEMESDIEYLLAQ